MSARGRVPAMRAVVATAALLLVAACAEVTPAGAAAFSPRQRVVALLSGHEVRSQPGAHGRATGSVGARRPITGAGTVLPVLAEALDEDARTWLRVRLPGRTLDGGSTTATGWIRASGTRRATTGWRIVVDIDARRVRIYRDGRRLRSYAAVVGKRATPTPRGDYFVEENIRLAADDAGAPFALATSARSSVLQEFAGGPGQIALHGLGNIGGRLGTAVSHGCVRLGDADVSWLAARIAPGTPVKIV
jgi:lipoprotein-anchoring transpeptidase ErfK/SrfK